MVMLSDEDHPLLLNNTQPQASVEQHFPFDEVVCKE